MKVLVINSGSSSLKYQLFDMKDESVLAKGIIEEIGTEQAIHRQDNTPSLPPQTDLRVLEHKEAITHMCGADGSGQRVHRLGAGNRGSRAPDCPWRRILFGFGTGGR